jgi:serine/threonine protein kinase
VDELEIGRVLLDQYLLEERLGAGSNGTVWRAIDAQTGERVAIKALHPHLTEAASSIDRFMREAEVLLRLSHPNIAGARRLARDGDRLWFVLDLAPGRTLDLVVGARTLRGQPFTDAEVRQLFDQLAAAIAHAHALGVVHRDLKPLNVMVDETPRGLSLKLLDFGLAKLVMETDERDATTRGRRLGSMFYMAPEQVRGEPVDQRADVFALGTMLFELLALHRAWAADPQGEPLPAFDKPVRATLQNAPTEVFRRILTGPRPVVSRYRRTASAALDAVVQRALALDPADRYPDVGALHRAVREVLAVDSAEDTAPQRYGALVNPPTHGLTGVLALEGSSNTEVLAEDSLTPLVELTATRLTPTPGDARQALDARVTPAEASMLELDATPALSPPPRGLSQPAIVVSTAPPSETRWRWGALVASIAATAVAALSLWVVQSGATAAPEPVPSASASAPAAAPPVVARAHTSSRATDAVATPAGAAEAPASVAPVPVGVAPAPVTSEPRATTPSRAALAPEPAASAGRRPRVARVSPEPAAEPSRRARPYPRLWALLSEAKTRGDPSSISRLGDAIVGAAAADVDDEAARLRIQRLAESSSLVGDLAGLELSLSLLSQASSP